MSPKIILVVDDDASHSRTLSDILRVKGYTPTAAATGQEALQCVEAETPAVALIDLRLGDMSGLRLMKAIKERAPGTECIMLTGYASKASAVEAINLGAYGYAEKPVDVNQLLLTIHRAIEKRQAEVALRESEEKYRLVSENIPVVVYSALPDEHATHVFVSGRAEELTGYSVEALLGDAELWPALVHPQDRPHVWEAIEAHRRNRAPLEVEYRIVTKDQGVKWITDRATPALDERGEIVRIDGFREDITERKRLEHQTEERRLYLESVLSCAPNAIVTLDVQQNVLEWNQGAEKLFGYSRKEALGRNLDGLLTSANSDAFEDASAITRKVLRRDAVPPRETIRFHKDGTPRHVILSGAPILIDGRLAGVAAAYIDISDRKRAQEALRETEERYRGFVQNFQGIAFRADMYRTPIFFHGAVEAITGYTEDRFLAGNPSWDDVIHPEDLHILYSQDAEKLHSVPHYSFEREYRIVHKDGGTRWVHEVIQNVCGDYDEIEMVQGAIYDVTERKRAEAAETLHKQELRQLKEFNEDIVQSMGEGIVVQDAEGCLAFVNPAAASLLGYAPEDLAGQHWKTIVPKDQHAIVEAADDRRRRGETNRYQMEFIRRDGTRLPVLVIASPRLDADTGEFIGIMAVFADISDQKAAEEEIQQRAAHAEALNAVIASATTASDLQELLEIALERTLHAVGLEQGAMWVGNLQAARGLSQELSASARQTAQAAGIHLSGPIAVDDWQQLSGDDPLAPYKPLAGRSGVSTCLLVPVLTDGQPVGGLALFGPAPHRWRRQEIGLAEAVGRQVGEAAERLRLLERTVTQAQQVQQIIDSVPEGVLLLDSEGQVIVANPAAQIHLAVLTGREVSDTVTHLGNRPLSELLAAPPAGLWHEVNADRMTFEVIARPLEAGPEPQGWVLVVRDVTEEREIQRRILQQERLAAVGQLAGGIAHEFNNLLTVIHLSSRLLERRLRREDPASEYVRRIGETAQRAANLTRQLLNFSRREIVEPRALNLNGVVRELSKMLHRIIGEDIELALELADDLWQVDADPAQIDQIVMNLIINARDAMPAGGRLVIATTNVVLDQSDRPTHREVLPGEYAMLAVSDSGVGMDVEVRERIFEPFFTTKETGKGTGLGLSTVYGIVEQSAGHVVVSSEAGQGTTFRIYLPRSAGAGGRAASMAPRPEAAASLRHSETILLVEDDPDVRELAARILEEQGYHVLTAQEGVDALQVSGQYGGSIDLLLTDVVMPGMHGQQLAESLRRERPETSTSPRKSLGSLSF